MKSLSLLAGRTVHVHVNPITLILSILFVMVFTSAQLYIFKCTSKEFYHGLMEANTMNLDQAVPTEED